MTNSTIDWTDNNTFLSLDEAAKLIPGADRGSLKRLIRRGILTAYKPGKAYMTTAANVREAVIKCRVVPAHERISRPTPTMPNSLGLTEMDLGNMALDLARAGIRRPTKKVERLSEEDSSRLAAAHRLETQQRRRARARKRYREKKAERAKELPDQG